MSASEIQSALWTTDWRPDLTSRASGRLSVIDPNIDDPVNDTGIGPRRGDLQLSDEFACLSKAICEGSGEFS